MIDRKRIREDDPIPSIRWHAKLRRKILLTILALGVVAECAALALAADLITGVVRNQTLGRPVSGDEVILLRIDQNRQEEEESRAQTDAQGAFTFSVADPDKLHVLRVVQQGINYDQRVSPGSSVAIDVFDAAATVQGITGNIEIVRIGTRKNLLHVSDMVEIKNDSSPPVTKGGGRTFEVYLPRRARIDSVLAAGPDKIGVMISAAPIAGDPGHFVVNFPLRPGATKFAFNYDLPYDGRAAFHPRSALPLHQLAVMIPPSMKFASRSSSFQLLATGGDSYRVEAVNDLPAGDGPGFEISGAGAQPAIVARTPTTRVTAAPATVSSEPETSSTPVHPAIRGRAPRADSSSDSLLRWRWFAMGAGSVLLPGALGFWLVRRRKRTAAAPRAVETQQASATFSIQTLKEEIFQLAVERVQGGIGVEAQDAAKNKAPSGGGLVKT